VEDRFDRCFSKEGGDAELDNTLHGSDTMEAYSRRPASRAFVASVNESPETQLGR
jgi:hypothetical protein